MTPVSSVAAPVLSALIAIALAGMSAAWFWLLLRIAMRRPVFGPPVVRVVPWGIRSVATMLLGYVAVNMIVVNAYVGFTHRPRNVPFGYTEQMFLVTVVNCVSVVILPLVLHTLSAARALDFGLERERLAPAVKAGALAFLIVTWPVNGLNVACGLIWIPRQHPLQEMVQAGLTRDVAYLALISAVIFAPLLEEFLFRGVLQAWLAQLIEHWSTRKPSPPDDSWTAELPSRELEYEPTPTPRAWLRLVPVVLTSAFFAAAHASQWPAPIPILMLSIALGIVYQRTGSLVASFVLHALFNGFSTLVLFWVILHPEAATVKAVAPPPQDLITVVAAFWRAGH
jgi:membrane protease YdiL (CAAX protease family)